MRGEDAVDIVSTVTVPETPPRAWGRLPVSEKTVPPTGNTPTCVGKTAADRAARYVRQKHPHVRGEDATGGAEIGPCEETPPRAWGRHQHIVKEREFNHNIHVLRQF